jgi:CheY-like chemotaxis protein
MNTSPGWDIIRLTTRDRLKLLDALDSGFSTGYAHKAAPFRHESISVMIEHSPGLEIAYLVCPRMISVSGLWFIHGGYLHPGTTVKVYLPTLAGGVECFSAAVEKCKLVAGNIHDVRVAFNLALEVEEFLPPAPKPSPESRPPRCTLAVERDPLRADRLRSMLSEEQTEVHVVPELADAMDAIERHTPDVVIAYTTPARARAVVKTIRIFEHAGGIVGIVPRPQLRRADEVEAEGFAAVLAWPFARRQLTAALRVANTHPAASSGVVPPPSS